MEMPQERKMMESEYAPINGFYSVKGGHNQLFLEPEKYTSLIEAALTALEEKKKKLTNQ